MEDELTNYANTIEHMTKEIVCKMEIYGHEIPNEFYLRTNFCSAIIQLNHTDNHEGRN